MINNLRFRLTVVFISLAIGPLLIIGIVVNRLNFHTLENQSLALQKKIAEKVGTEIRAFVENKLHELVLLDKVHRLGTLPYEEQYLLLNKMLFLEHIYQEMSLLDPNGNELIRLSRSQVFLKGNFQNRSENEVFLFPSTTHEMYFGPIRFDKTIREPLFTISLPLFDKRTGEIVSILVAELRCKKIWELLASMELANESDIYVINDQGYVIAHRNPAVVLRGTMIDLPEKDGHAKGLSGTTVFIARDSLRFGNQEFIVVSEITASNALKLALLNRRIAIGLIIIALFAAITLVIFTTRSFIRPIDKLVQAAESVSKGDLTQQVEVSSQKNHTLIDRGLLTIFRFLSTAIQKLTLNKWQPNISKEIRDEIGELSQTFNTMTRYLREREETLKAQKKALQQARNELEAKVEERTAELVDTNRQLQSEIAERKCAEEALRAERDKAQKYLDVAGTMLVVLDVDGNVNLINKKGCEILKYKEDDIIGKNWFDTFIPKRLKEKVKAVFFQLIAGEVTSSEYFENIVMTCTGEERIISWHNTVLFDDAGNIMGTLSSGEDITSRKKMENELLKAQKMESLGVLAGGIAHDFNNILTAILGNISIAKMAADSGKNISGFLTEAEKASMRAKGLTQQLLTFSKGGAPIKETICIDEIIKDTVSFALRGSNVRCVFSIPDNLYPVEVDKGQISQVVNNLIINAIQAMPEGGTIHVLVENMLVEKTNPLPLVGKNYIKIAVQDHGVGIPEKYIQKIFDPYFTTKGKGSGLGLATAYSIIKKHGGQISVDSEDGVGTIFSIYLPVSKKEIPIQGRKSEELISGTGKILVMDDEKQIVDVLSNMLVLLGYNIKFAKDGASAIKLYKQAKTSGSPFDVVILDLTNPGGMGGKETIEKLLTIDPKVKALVSSGYSNDPIMSKFRDYGFSGVISKPYRLHELSKIIHKVIMK